MNGFVRSHHRFMLEQVYNMILAYEKMIKSMEERIDQVLEGYQEEVAVLDELPGIDRKTDAVIIAEIRTDMTQFPSAEHLASWAGLCPGNNESSGKRKSTHITKGNTYLKKVLCQAAFAASRSKDTKFKAHFYRIKKIEEHKSRCSDCSFPIKNHLHFIIDKTTLSRIWGRL